ncbi:glucan biosynthesis protein, periplasmic [Georgfuchsia toluolica]|uniref:Glucans biosynthesis protein G n=1 Tax=Georgfuchsia toluolica TaxID=424218 RepID=A0A916N189_9PROT|nr:glucan biosynthesis protein G [Georgfuchsia toluolica]CAG4882380.1 glucan biosynthesis protein, periplasmic [Georgfuchsia toluolica]
MRIIRAACLVVLWFCLPSFNNVHAFDFDDVNRQARQLATASYQKPDNDLTTELKNLSYDQYRDIRFRPEASLWRSDGLPFEVAFFHRGGFFQEKVKINEIAGNAVREIKFDPNRFDYGRNKIDVTRMRSLGFSGFRLHYPINRAGYKDEVAAFLGASYFRALGKNQLYGVSARGLAVDTAQSSGEEFPRFTEFWLERPEQAAKQIRFYALLDSPRVTGAYRFVLTPGEDTVMDVKVRLYLRDKVALIGVAPLTSMFLFGENQHFGGDDYRPEVHDSDGLSIHSGSGEWLWRPLLDPKRLLVTSFAQNDPLGFGLMQRDRNFCHYEDLEAHYQQRPSVWIEPRGKWGSGRVELVQIPVPDETNDNIVAFWVPDAPMQPGEARDFEYRMLWQKNKETTPPGAWVVQTRRGRAYTKNLDSSIGLLVDFDGPALRKLAANVKPKLIVSADANGQIIESEVYRNDVNGGWRLSLRVRRVDAAKPVEMRAQLRGNGNKESETWSYILPPE